MRLLLWVFLLAVATQAEKVGELDIIDFDSFVSKNLMNEGTTILVAVNEAKKLDEPYRSELNKFKASIDESWPALKIFAISDPKFVQRFSPIKLPQVIFYRNGRYIQYQGTLNAVKLSEMMETYRERLSRDLTDANFEHDTQASTGSTTGDWFVMLLENRVLFAYVNYDENPNLQERFNLNYSPTIIFFKGGSMYRYELKNFEADSFVSFATAAYKNIKSEKVPTERTSFDRIVDWTVQLLKELSRFKKQKFEERKTVILVGGLVGISLIAGLAFCLKSKKKSLRKPTGPNRYSYESKEYYKLE